MTMLVTGACGFIGSAVVRHLLNEGCEVRVLKRPGSDDRNLAGLPLETAVGDLTDRPSLDRALKGCNVLFHVAADYRLWAINPEELYQNNVLGTRNMMAAALDAGIERIVYTSSVATLGLTSDDSPADERTPSTMNTVIGHYKRSKFLAEAEVRTMIAEQGLPAVIVNPSAPMGPRDIRPTPTGRIILDAVCGRIPAYVDTGLNVVHVDDVAAGHYLALRKGKIGERYILGGENLTLQAILGEIAQAIGRPAPRLRLSHHVVMPIAYLAEFWARMAHQDEPLITVDGVRMAKKYMYFSAEKARRELGFKPRPAKEAIFDAVDWFQTRAVERLSGCHA